MMSSSSSSMFFSLKCLIWDSLSTYFFFLFTLFRTRVFRSKKSNGMKHDAAGGSKTELDPDGEAEDDGLGVLMAFNGDDLCEEREEPKFGFAFRFQTYEEFHRTRIDDIDRLPIASTGKSFCAYLDELEERNRDVGEEDEVKNSTSDSVPERVDDEEEKPMEAEDESMGTVRDVDCEEGKSCSDSESSTGSVPLTLPRNQSLESCSDGFASDRDEIQKPAHIDTVMAGSDDQISDRDLNEETPFTCSSSEEEEDDVYTTEELSRIEQTHFRDMESLEPSDNKETKSLSEDFESDESESLWEHQELMEQLKTELENVKTKGLLPTIEEDSEYSKISEDLKPWKMEQKPVKDEQMDSLHKIHKAYSERMKKFDMLNFQKMYAMGLVQLKNRGGEGLSTENRARSNWYHRRKKVLNESVLKLMRDLQNDMEVAYVGQLCLSWDFLHLQYKTALQIWQSDARRLRRYCDVALQFQRFQVLMYHFMEEEPFRGPRVEHYAKTRCILRHLLQIPLIREDKRKKGGQWPGVVVTSDMLVETIEESIRIFWRFLKGDQDSKFSDRKRLGCMDCAESEQVKEIRRDVGKLMVLLRRENCIVRKLKWMKARGKEVENKDKGEGQEEEEDPAVYFLSKVDVRLVARVVNMSGPGLTMERLAWCRTKLDNITFKSRTKTLHLGPSFLLFPA